MPARTDSRLWTMKVTGLSNKKPGDNARSRERLMQLRHELESLADTNNASSGTVELDQARVGRLSRMDAMQAQAMSQASGRRRDVMLRKIDAALQRLENDEFGVCLSCREPIAEKRLEIDPTVTLCIACAGKAEARR